MTYALIVSFYF